LSSKGSDMDLVDPFTIQFEEDQTSFSLEDHPEYLPQFEQIYDNIKDSGTVKFVFVGNVDPSLFVATILDVAMNYPKGNPILTRTGQKGNWSYYLDNKPFNVESIPALIKLIEDKRIAGCISEKYGQKTPSELYQAIVSKSKERAEAAQAAVVKYLQSRGVKIDLADAATAVQFSVTGAGCREPIVSFRESAERKKANMYVRVHVLKFSVENLTPPDFDY
jgi:hypothetical protein